MAEVSLPPLPPDRLPRHVAIIMDGNGRWAKQRGLPRLEGHRRGVETVRTTVDAARAMGVRYITLYAFSAENWKRPAEEVGGLMGLLEFFLKRELAALVRDKVRLHAIGRVSELPAPVYRQLCSTIEATAGFDDYHLTLALNYGARTEVLDAVRNYASAVAAGKADPARLDWEGFANHLYTSGLPDPDLIIRTSGESRISNFLLLQGAYAEYFFTDILWPDFKPADLHTALVAFSKRERRFGLTSEQLNPAP
ncbi:polyprenyl diphosphate synthase [Nibricoccus sp. IMCC34717]|uniref:polyprenyl diphosphate synthase n=1 Tax=Nibricoccus sp. IMCC34717 TaxID=3034021 RepID=UPI00384D9981